VRERERERANSHVHLKTTTKRKQKEQCYYYYQRFWISSKIGRSHTKTTRRALIKSNLFLFPLSKTIILRGDICLNPLIKIFFPTALPTPRCARKKNSTVTCFYLGLVGAGDYIFSEVKEDCCRVRLHSKFPNN
jgi:hypothetical protein